VRAVLALDGHTHTIADAFADTDAFADADADADAFADSNAYTYPFAYSVAYTNPNAGDCDGHAQPNAIADAITYAQPNAIAFAKSNAIAFAQPIAFAESYGAAGDPATNGRESRNRHGLVHVDVAPWLRRNVDR
jgi:hypothetical protein